MNSKFDTLSDLDIDKIRELVDVLDKSTFDHLTLELDDFRLTLGTGVPDPAPMAGPSLFTTPPVAHTAVAPTIAQAPAARGSLAPKAEVSTEGLIDITAPTMGNFYSRPAPNSEPFVSIGSKVGTESTVGLLEIMKLFNSVTAGVDGVVEQICVEDAELVEFGQVLMRVRPSL